MSAARGRHQDQGASGFPPVACRRLDLPLPFSRDPWRRQPGHPGLGCGTGSLQSRVLGAVARLRFDARVRLQDFRWHPTVSVPNPSRLSFFQCDRARPPACMPFVEGVFRRLPIFRRHGTPVALPSIALPVPPTRGSSSAGNASVEADEPRHPPGSPRRVPSPLCPSSPRFRRLGQDGRRVPFVSDSGRSAGR
jgi:hypothetical protein